LFFGSYFFLIPNVYRTSFIRSFCILGFEKKYNSIKLGDLGSEKSEEENIVGEE